MAQTEGLLDRNQGHRSFVDSNQGLVLKAQTEALLDRNQDHRSFVDANQGLVLKA
jgi:DNA-binding GntR family transcriptional regulator